MYEACRLFRDKLVEEEDIQKFDGFLLSSIQSDWGVDMRDSLLNTFFVTAAIATVGDKVLFIHIFSFLLELSRVSLTCLFIIFTFILLNATSCVFAEVYGHKLEKSYR